MAETEVQRMKRELCSFCDKVVDGKQLWREVKTYEEVDDEIVVVYQCRMHGKVAEPKCPIFDFSSDQKGVYHSCGFDRTGYRGAS